MFRNYIKVAFRNLLKHKVYSFINIFGLAVGLACFLFVLLFIENQLRFDNFHEHRDSIYRVGMAKAENNGIFYTASTMSPLAPALKNEMSAVEQVVRVERAGKTLVRKDNVKFYEKHIFWVDPAFLQIFTFETIAGDPGTALVNPYSAVLTESIAEKYFGETGPVGRTILIDQNEFVVTAIVEDPPHNTDLRFEILLSYTTIADEAAHKWTSFYLQTFLLLPPEVSRSDVENAFAGILRKHTTPKTASEIDLFLQPLPEMHLYKIGRTSGLIIMVYVLSAIGFIILIIAAINYMNLATARAVKRSREVGLRKVVGAKRIQLIKQFLGESLLFSCLALPLALGILEFSLPVFNNLIGSAINVNLNLNVFKEPQMILMLGSVILLIGMISGCYPAFFLSRYAPVSVLKESVNTGSRGRFIRKTLVVTQFVFSVIFIIYTGILEEQMNYLKSRDLGFDPEQVINLNIENIEIDDATLVKNSLMQQHDVITASLNTTPPARPFRKWSTGVTPEGFPSDERISMQVFSVDENYLETFGLEIVRGRDFSDKFLTDQTEGYIINETAVALLNWQDPIGKTIHMSGNPDQGTVIGVVKDFHFDRLTNEIDPAILHIVPNAYNTLSLKIRSDDLTRTLSQISSVWNELLPEYPIEYAFLDEATENMFREFILASQFFKGFSFFAIFIAMLGLFGLIAFTAEQRTKEIGIRKVLGASDSSVFILLSKEFSKLILLANAIAWPVVYLVAQQVLQMMTYRTELSWRPFVFTTGIIIVLTTLTVLLQSLKTIRMKPVETLRYE